MCAWPSRISVWNLTTLSSCDLSLYAVYLIYEINKLHFHLFDFDHSFWNPHLALWYSGEFIQLALRIHEFLTSDSRANFRNVSSFSYFCFCSGTTRGILIPTKNPTRKVQNSNGSQSKFVQYVLWELSFLTLIPKMTKLPSISGITQGHTSPFWCCHGCHKLCNPIGSQRSR